MTGATHRPEHQPRVRPCRRELPRLSTGLAAALSAAAAILAAALLVAAALAQEPAGPRPRWLARAAAAPAETLTIWVTFRDKGERDDRDLARRLARAEQGLSPRARARRERAGLHPPVDVSDLPLEPAYLEALTARGLRPFAASRWLNRVALRVPGARAAELAALPFVQGLELAPRVRRSLPPSPGTGAGARYPGTPLEALRAAVDYGNHRAPLEQIGVPALHDSGYTGSGLLIAVFDEGFNQHDTHEALVSALPEPGHRRDFAEGDTVVTNPAQPGAFSHGTWTLGILAANRPGTYVGAAFGADFALARTEVTGSEQPTEMLYWAQAAEWADSLGVDLISSSLGYFAFDDPFPDYTYDDMDGATTDVTRAARIAAARGMLVVNSVGNEGNKPWHWLIAPADVHGDSLIAVGAVDASGFVAAFSSFGPTADGRVKPDLAARGVASPLVAATGGPAAYTAGDGTSFAAPLVAGLAACLWQARPAWRAVDVIRALRETASRASSPNDRIGYGIPNGAAAMCWGVSGSMGAPGTAIVLGPNPMLRGGPPVRVRLLAGGVQSGRQRGRVRVFDARGRELASLWSGEITRGQCLDVDWDGSGADGRRAPPGIYYIALSAGGEVATARVISLQ